MREYTISAKGWFCRLALAFSGLLICWPSSPCQDKIRPVNLENLTWVQAGQVFKEYDVVLIAFGARTKEHGPHLPLKTDYIMAEYFKNRVAEQVPVAVLPTIQYGYYPSFLEYPGSVSIQAETFKTRSRTSAGR